MDSLLIKQQEYEKEIKKYSDTVMVLSAVYNTLKQKPPIADYVGVEIRLTSEKGNPIEPDLTALCEKRTKGLLFEFKWSLPFPDKWVDEKIQSLEDYSGRCTGWKNSAGVVDYHDLVLVCHMEDASRAKEAITRLVGDPKYAFLSAEGFAMWTWIISVSRKGGSGCGESLILTNQYGTIRNAILEDKTKPPTGLVFPQEALTWLRSSFHFIKMDPPVQYTIIKIIQHVFSQFQDTSKGKDYYELTTDMIYEKAKTIFFPWRDTDTQTIQAKRPWIVDSLENMYALKLIGKTPDKQKWLVPIPTIRPQGTLQKNICKRLAKHNLKVGTPRKSKIKHVKPESGTRKGLKPTTLMDFK